LLLCKLPIKCQVISGKSCNCLFAASWTRLSPKSEPSSIGFAHCCYRHLLLTAINLIEAEGVGESRDARGNRTRHWNIVAKWLEADHTPAIDRCDGAYVSDVPAAGELERLIGSNFRPGSSCYQKNRRIEGGKTSWCSSSRQTL